MWIDENRIIKQLMPQIFQTGMSVVAELVQNSYRAKASTVNIESNKEAGKLAIHDDGAGQRSICSRQIRIRGPR